MHWTPNKVTALRVLVGFAAVALFGHGTWANLAALALTVAAIPPHPPGRPLAPPARGGNPPRQTPPPGENCRSHDLNPNTTHNRIPSSPSAKKNTTSRP